MNTADFVRELKTRNPQMPISSIAFYAGVTKQQVNAMLVEHKKWYDEQRAALKQEEDDEYKAEINYIRKTIEARGRIWECARRPFEAGTYRDETIARLLSERIIIPHPDPDGGYILPSNARKQQ